jgi:hypothetical protein
VKKLLAYLALALSSISAQAVDLLGEALYGVDYGPISTVWLSNMSVASVTAKTVNLAAVDATSISVSIYGVGNLTFTGSKVAGNGTTRPDVWTGVGGAYTMRITRDGERLSAEIRTGTAKYRAFQVVRYDSSGMGLLVFMKSEDAQMKGVNETFPL